MSTEVPEHRKAWAIYEKELPNYWDATKVPSISGVLAWAFGGPPDVPAVHIALDRGGKVHQCLQFLDEGDLYWDSIRGSELEGYIKAWREWLEPGDEFLLIEEPLWANLAGVDFIVRPDRVLKRRGRVMIADVKTKSRVGRLPNEQEQRQHGIEVAAQAVALEQRRGLAADVVGCVYCWPDKTKFVRYGLDKGIDELGDILGRWKAAQEQQRATG